MSESPEWVYVTKWALSEGIRREKVDSWSDSGRPWVRRRYTYFNPGEYAADWATAVEQADALRRKRIASLAKQLTKLERLTWKEPAEVPQP